MTASAPFLSEDRRFVLRKVQDARITQVWWRCPTCGETRSPGKTLRIYSVTVPEGRHGTLLFCCEGCEVRWTRDPGRGGLPHPVRALLQPDRKGDTGP